MAFRRVRSRRAVRYISLRFWLLVILTGFTAGVTGAQDLKPIASSLSAGISSSGHRTAAVVDFTDLEGNPTGLGRFLAEEMSIDLFQIAKGYSVIDRTHLKAILQEHRLSATGLIDPQTARKLGQISGADVLVTGTITPFGDTIRLSAKALDTETAKLIAASTADIPKTPAIVAMLNETESVAPTGEGTTGPSTPPRSNHDGITAQSSTLESGLLFGARSCVRSGRTLTCSGYVSNKTPKRRQIILNWTRPASVVDDLGNQYIVANEKLVFGSKGADQILEPDLPVNFSFSLEDVNPAATRATIIFAGASYGELEFRAVIRNVLIQRR